MEQYEFLKELPPLKKKQATFAHRFVTNGESSTEAYIFAYKPQNMSLTSVRVEASKLLKNPNITLTIKILRYRTNQIIFENDLCSRIATIQELNDIIQICTKNNKFSQLLKAMDMRNKILGFYEKDNLQRSSITTVMNDVEIDDQKMDFDVGSEIENTELNND